MSDRRSNLGSEKVDLADSLAMPGWIGGPPIHMRLNAIIVQGAAPASHLLGSSPQLYALPGNGL